MRTSIRKIGNSRGILIPSAFLTACGIGTHVDIFMEGKSLLIRPVQEPRAGWFEGFKSEMDVDPLGDLPVDEGDEDWTW
ncbi:AbrB family transcriptional regulator [Acidithiobacillus ferrivorans]|uniref:AbrB/MazE/SpoVT family DNA-binding domain-containing protein n=1 Tax=Acidithiobacillus ferrivorans TaxID=160808 RepID=UPI001C06F22C|nr:AbrB family transcriptional regulator [Acidithiobacillus ferrivorans]MBU2850923.1 AbrB family transcriptional regulator [Acidithiobacillus ferrivorans]